MRKIILLAAALAAAAAAVAGCAAVRQAAAKASCFGMSGHWFKNGGTTRMVAVEHALTNVGHADTAAGHARFTPATVTGIKTADSKLTAAIAALRRDLPPSCVTGTRADMSAGLSDFASAVRDQETAVAAVQAKNPAAARAAFTRAARAFQAGSHKFGAAAHAIRAYVKS
jgi:hypothetical protein